ncbi:MAG: ABC transporter ATP-binding protein, partial [Acutalibacteraceae bacterium]
MEEKIIQFKNIVKSYDGEKSVLDNISLDIYENEFVTLLGPSGCGKTTLLRILGGFLTPDSGSVIFEGKDISSLPPYKREVNTVFQSYALFTHLNVFENIAFGLRIKKEPQDVIVQKVKRMLKLVNLEGYEKRKVTDLSGGQQQRIAIARALVNEPKVLLLDEPLAALDTKLRKEMQQELIRIQEEVGITFIFVTHDQEEALTLSDKIVVMDGGKIQQVGTPEEVYNNPANRFVANFIGEINMVEGVMVEDGVVCFEDKRFQCQAEGFAPGEKVDVVLRPNHIDVVPKENGMLKGVVKSHIFKGINHQLIVETRVGTSITISLQLTDDKPVFSQESGEKISASNFLLDLEDVAELSDSTVIAFAWE